VRPERPDAAAAVERPDAAGAVERPDAAGAAWLDVVARASGRGEVARTQPKADEMEIFSTQHAHLSLQSSLFRQTMRSHAIFSEFT
jgi:hypothetical protein